MLCGHCGASDLLAVAALATSGSPCLAESGRSAAHAHCPHCAGKSSELLFADMQTLYHHPVPQSWPRFCPVGSHLGWFKSRCLSHLVLIQLLCPLTILVKDKNSGKVVTCILVTSLDCCSQGAGLALLGVHGRRRPGVTLRPSSLQE